MTRHHKKRSQARLLRSLYIWHRYFGISAAVFVVVLSISGLLLNHTEELELDSSYVQSDFLLNWYGIHAPRELTSFTSGTITVTAATDQIFWGDEYLPHVSAPLVGMLIYGDLVVIASGGSLSLYTTDGELVEKLNQIAGVPDGIVALGITPQALLAVKTAQGVYLTDENMLEWRRDNKSEVLWSETSPLPANLESGLQRSYRGIGLSAERVMLDLHSGRILGRAGVYLVDAAAIVFLLLAISGVWLWMRRQASIRAHQRKTKSMDAARK
jgi:hypothetical protein